jgi:hypothetical protein
MGDNAAVAALAVGPLGFLGQHGAGWSERVECEEECCRRGELKVARGMGLFQRAALLWNDKAKILQFAIYHLFLFC